MIQAQITYFFAQIRSIVDSRDNLAACKLQGVKIKLYFKYYQLDLNHQMQSFLEYAFVVVI